MDLSYSEEQRLLRDSAERFVRNTCTPEERRRAATAPGGYSEETWRRIAELGWLALAIPEEFSGLGGGAIETAVVMEALGRGLAPEPYLSTAVLGTSLILAAGSAAQKSDLLPRVAAGDLQIAFAHAERSTGFDPGLVDTRAERSQAGWRLTGRKIAVLDGATAGMLIVSARTADAVGLFLVAPGTKGIARQDYPRLGGGRACDLELSGAEVPASARLGDETDALAAIEIAVDRALSALCAEAVGIMQHLFEATTEYTKIRQQFGRPLAANQVVRHRLADMATCCEEARSIALLAALKADADAAERGRAASAAKAKVGRCARFVGEQAIQLHGAMGVTEELEIGQYFKRLVAFESLFGSASHHYRRVAKLARVRAKACPRA
jgi:alkylation response protein AidB-like acyl-CoA dehydrogenase